ncbi:glycosyl transferase [Marinobacter guineae]|uniref:Glycosyl transferase n=1 Tax=Marinobacter guineae TaxID=432303 RepID=A0A2G1VHT8_9GAMM|nr:ATP-grasp fold amidoligase family protein [Marinobacter guineae]PHQ26347.1 glycosyl transferase [Marinobacter guineae]
MDFFLSDLKSFARKSLNDEFIIAKNFRNTFGRRMNFFNPETFNEKLQLQKLYNRNPRMTFLSDKYLARQHIKNLGLANILNVLIGVYDRAEDIDFSSLPQAFVIKCNHSWATNIICSDKSELIEEEVIARLNDWLAINHYYILREWCYKDIKPKIIIERHLGKDLKDFKFFCFEGLPHYIQVDCDRFGAHTLDIYDMNWNRLECRKGNKKQSATPMSPPTYFQEMVNAAKTISSEFNFCRVDFLATPDAFYFCEVTFYPGGGFSSFQPEQFDYLFGEKLNVSDLKIPLKSRLKIGAISLLDRMGFV